MFAILPDSPVFCSNIFFKSTSNQPLFARRSIFGETSSKAKLLVAPTFFLFFFLFESWDRILRKIYSIYVRIEYNSDSMVSNLQTEYPAKTLAVDVGPSLYAIFTYERRIGASHSDARTSRRLADADWLERRRPSVFTARRDAQRPDTARRGRSRSFVPFRLRSFPPLAFSCDSSTRTVCPPRRSTSGCSLSPLFPSLTCSLFFSRSLARRVLSSLWYFSQRVKNETGVKERETRLGKWTKTNATVVNLLAYYITGNILRKVPFLCSTSSSIATSTLRRRVKKKKKNRDLRCEDWILIGVSFTCTTFLNDI